MPGGAACGLRTSTTSDSTFACRRRPSGVRFGGRLSPSGPPLRVVFASSSRGRFRVLPERRFRRCPACSAGTRFRASGLGRIRRLIGPPIRVRGRYLLTPFRGCLQVYATASFRRVDACSFRLLSGVLSRVFCTGAGDAVAGPSRVDDLFVPSVVAYPSPVVGANGVAGSTGGLSCVPADALARSSAVASRVLRYPVDRVSRRDWRTPLGAVFRRTPVRVFGVPVYCSAGGPRRLVDAFGDVVRRTPKLRFRGWPGRALGVGQRDGVRPCSRSRGRSRLGVGARSGGGGS